MSTGLQGIQKEVNKNENITEHFQELEEEAKEDLLNIETQSLTQDQESTLGENNTLHGQLLLAENYETLGRGSSEIGNDIQSAIGNTLETQKLSHQSNDSQTTFDLYLSGRYPDMVRNILYNGSQEKEFAEANLGSNEEILPQEEHHMNNTQQNTYIHNIIDGNSLPFDDILQGQIDLLSDPITPKPTSNVEPVLENEYQIFVPNNKFEQEQTEIPASINEKLKPALKEISSIHGKLSDYINHEELQKQEQYADSGTTGKIKMGLINLPANQSAPENKDNANIGHKETIAFLDQNGTRMFATNIQQGQSQTVSGFIKNREKKWADLSSAQILNHSEILKTHSNEASSYKIAQKELSNNFISQEVTEVTSVDIDKERPHISLDPSNDFDKKCTNLSTTQKFKEYSYAHNGNIKPEQTQIITAHVKEVDCSSCGNVLQEPLSHDLTNQEVIEVSSDINQDQSHISYDLINNENIEWSDTHSTIVKDNTQFPSNHIYNEQAEIFPIQMNEEIHILPETYNVENIQILKFKDNESNTDEEFLSNKHLFAMTNLRQLLSQLQIQLKRDNNIQLSRFYTMIKFIYLVFKSQRVEDKSEYSIWFWQLHPEVRARLIKYANILCRLRWVQQLMLKLHNNRYNLDIVKQRGLASHLMSWYHRLINDQKKNLDKPTTREDVRKKILGRLIFTRPCVQSHRVYHFRRPGLQKLTKTLRNLKTNF